LLNEELVTLSRNIKEARNITTLNKDIVKLTETIKKAGNFVSLNMELETLSGKIKETGHIASLNKELNKLSGSIQEAGNIATLYKELDKLSVKIQETGNLASLNDKLDILTEKITTAAGLVISSAPKLLSLHRKENPSEVSYEQSSISQENSSTLKPILYSSSLPKTPSVYKPVIYSLKSNDQERSNNYKPQLHSRNSIYKEKTSTDKPLAPKAPLPWLFPEWIPSNTRVPASTRLLQRSILDQKPAKIVQSKDFFRQFDSVFANLTE